MLGSVVLAAWFLVVLAEVPLVPALVATVAPLRSRFVAVLAACVSGAAVLAVLLPLVLAVVLAVPALVATAAPLRPLVCLAGGAGGLCQ